MVQDFIWPCTTITAAAAAAAATTTTTTTTTTTPTTPTTATNIYSINIFKNSTNANTFLFGGLSCQCSIL